MGMVMETMLYPAVADGEHRTRTITVLYTCEEGTIAALTAADALASRWHSPVVVLAPHIVPWPRQLGDPQVKSEFHEQRLEQLIRKAKVAACVHVYLCRDREETLRSVLAPGSIVVIGSRRRWWRTDEERLAEMLRRAGHDVIVTPVR